LVLAAGSLLTTGCVTGPDYERPVSDLPATWATTPEGGANAEPAAVSRWWELLNDPVLTQLVADAAAGNLDLQLAEARLREARAARGIAASTLMPTLGVSGSYKLEGSPDTTPDAGSPIGVGVSAGPGGLSRSLTYRGNNATVTRTVGATGANTSLSLNPSAEAPDRTQDMFMVGFDAGWELDLFGGNKRAVEAAEADIDAAEERLNAVMVSLAAEVALNYIDLREAQSRLDITQQNIAAQEQSVRLTRARFDAGLSSELDTIRASSLLATTQSQLPLLKAGVQTAIHRLGVLAGETPGAMQSTLEVQGAIPVAPASVPVGLPSELLLRRPDIRTAERELAAATARIGVAVADLYPKFSLTGSFTGREGDLGSLLSSAGRAWSIGPGVSWPIFDGGRIRANIEVQNTREDQAALVYKQVILYALEEVENGLVGFAQEQVRRESLAAAVESNRRSVRIANERYVQGLEDFLSVLNAQQQLFQSEDLLAQSQSLVLTNLVSLYKALGGGWEETPVEQHQASANS
jgi:NodT family efflux transporter outer membrane factor (OMF) lipoprotein